MDFAPELIRHIEIEINKTAKELRQDRLLRAADRQDFAQSCWLHVVRGFQRFDPTRSKAKTWAGLLVAGYAKIYRKLQQRRRPLPKIKLCGTMLSPPWTRQMVDFSADPVRRTEMTEAFESAVGRMPEQLRDVCRRLMHGSISSVARDLGVTRRQVCSLVRAARPYFEAAGFDGTDN